MTTIAYLIQLTPFIQGVFITGGKTARHDA